MEINIGDLVLASPCGSRVQGFQATVITTKVDIDCRELYEVVDQDGDTWFCEWVELTLDN